MQGAVSQRHGMSRSDLVSFHITPSLVILFFFRNENRFLAKLAPVLLFGQPLLSYGCSAR